MKFYFWTKTHEYNETSVTLMDMDKILIPGESDIFNPENPTKILIHGFSDNGKTRWIGDAKARYLRMQDCNVISVDWGALVR